MSQADTPDYQRGVVSAQKLLATVPNTDTSVTVGVPPNAETIVVLAPGSLNPSDFTCKGATTGLDYPPIPYGPSVTGANTTAVAFDVSAAVDDQVTITYGFAASFVWYVYSDSGVHVTINPFLARSQNQDGSPAPVDALQVGGTDGTDLRAFRADTNGQQFTIPAAPGTGASDHPPSELSFYGNVISAGGVLIGAAGAGKRYRVFSAQCAPAASTINGYLHDTVSGTPILAGTQNGSSFISFAPGGIPLSENAGVNWATNAGSGSMICVIAYTIETV